MKLKFINNNPFYLSVSSTDAVFHYTSKSIALEKILYEDKFKFSSLRNSNDPYEYKAKMIGAGGWGWTRDTENNIHNTLQILDKLLIENTSYFSSCSNTFDNNTLTDHGFLKSRMWAQYGENHEGICLVFSKEKLMRLLIEKYHSNYYDIYNENVEYRENITDYSGYDSISIDSDTFNNRSAKDVAISHLKQYKNELLFLKQLDYKDETEYRVVAVNTALDTSKVKFLEFKVSECLLGIILGEKFPKVYKPTINAICANLNTDYKKLHWEGHDYLLLDSL